MANIKPFRALQPNPFYADQLVFPGEEQVFFFNISQKQHPLLPLKEQLETPARQRPETIEGQKNAYREIQDNLERLLEMDRLREEEKPGIYIYEIVHRHYRQTGIWALTDIDDYLNGRIKVHELTLADSERRICNYRSNTGLEGSPVLLTYEPSLTVNRIIAETCAKDKKNTIGSKKSIHRIWKIEDAATISRLIDAFTEIDTVYMADGHHRMAATAKNAADNATQKYISSLYIATDQLHIQEYYRIIIPDTEIDGGALLSRLSSLFIIIASEQPVQPKEAHTIGLYLHGRWYELTALKKDRLDVVLLQDKVLAPLFGITDPRTDPRLKCIGGAQAMDETIIQLHDHPGAIAFCLFPLSVTQLIETAEAGQILPPKSTWIDPKVPYGLLLYRHLTNKNT